MPVAYADTALAIQDAGHRSDGWAGRSRCFSRSSRYGLADEKWAGACGEQHAQGRSCRCESGTRRLTATTRGQASERASKRSMIATTAACVYVWVHVLLQQLSRPEAVSPATFTRGAQHWSRVCLPQDRRLLKLWSAAAQFPLNPDPLPPKRAKVRPQATPLVPG